MAQTKYITVAEWAEGFDNNVMAELSSDTGTLGTVNESNTALLNCIERASADVESHALRGGIYSLTDLLDAQSDDDWSLKGLVASLATVYLYRVRGTPLPPDVKPLYEEAKATLKDLRDGKRVLNNAGAVDAGQPKVAVISASNRGNLHLQSDSMFFPRRLTNAV